MGRKALNMNHVFILRLNDSDRLLLSKLQEDYNMSVEFRKFIRTYAKRIKHNN